MIDWQNRLNLGGQGAFNSDTRYLTSAGRLNWPSYLSYVTRWLVGWTPVVIVDGLFAGISYVLHAFETWGD